MDPHRFWPGFSGRFWLRIRGQRTNGNPHTADENFPQEAAVFGDNFVFKRSDYGQGPDRAFLPTGSRF